MLVAYLHFEDDCFTHRHPHRYFREKCDAIGSFHTNMASLASLLNPSPDAEADPPRKDSLPPVHTTVHSHDSTVPPLSPASSRSGVNDTVRPHLSYAASSSTAHEAAQALASLSTSPAPPPAQWGAYGGHGGEIERYMSAERRASNYGNAMQLPPLSTDSARKMSSPTLDQYHVASRSPENRRPAALPSPQTNMAITLPPIQDHAASSVDRRPSQTLHHHSASLEMDAARISERESAQAAVASTLVDSSALSHIQRPTSNTSAIVATKGELESPMAASPVGSRQPTDMDGQMTRAVASLKQEPSQRTQSPLRESSVPVPTTEMSAKEEPAASKKRAAPAKTKKGTASTVRKDRAPPAKKRKVDSKRAETPSSRASKAPALKGTSAKGTPLNSSPVPSTRSYSADPHEEDQLDEEDEEMDEEREGDSDLYCLCRKPDTGTFMIGCDGTCDDWFHGKCVGIEERDKNLIDKYMCPSCTQAGIGRTTFKRMCRRSGCRQPAKTAKTKSGTQASKYCSDECGVLYFREMVAKTRGREESGKSRAARRKPSLDVPDKQIASEDDLGARGGPLAAGEVKTLLGSSKTAEDFKKLGDGVLSPPATPDGTNEGEIGDFTDVELEAIKRIQTAKEIARQRHALLKERLKFVAMAKQAASRAASDRELKPKEYCGYDPRLEWTEERFQEWRNSETGRQAFQVETLATGKVNSSAEHFDDDEQPLDICDRKKCARHLDWSKLATDDLRFEMGDNSDRMRGLDRAEKEIQERAALRSRTSHLNGEGSVELHGLGITASAADEMEVDNA